MKPYAISFRLEDQDETVQVSMAARFKCLNCGSKSHGYVVVVLVLSWWPHLNSFKTKTNGNQFIILSYTNHLAAKQIEKYTVDVYYTSVCISNLYIYMRSPCDFAYSMICKLDNTHMYMALIQ